MPKISQERLLARERGIVQAAARCLQRKGLEATGMRDLFRAANLSPGAVYRYFSSKDELLAAVAATTPIVSEVALAATSDDQAPAARLRSLLAAAAAVPTTARLQIELQTAALSSPRVAAALAQRRAAGRRALTEALTTADDPPAVEILDLVDAACEGLARSRLLNPEADLSARAEAAGRVLAAALG